MTAWQFAFLATLLVCVLYMHYAAKANAQPWPRGMKFAAVFLVLGYDLILATLVAMATAFIFRFV